MAEFTHTDIMDWINDNVRKASVFENASKECNRLQKANVDLEKCNETLKKAIALLKIDNTKLQTTNENLEKDNRAFRKVIGSLKEDNFKLQTANENLEKEIKIIRSQSKELRKKELEKVLWAMLENINVIDDIPPIE